MSQHGKTRVLFVNRSYWPDAEATGQLLTELTEDLAARFEIEVLCGQPNSNPSGDQYRRWGREVRKGVTIRRVPHLRFPKHWGSRWRMVYMASFFLSAAISALFRRRPDMVICETDPPFLCFIGIMLKRLRGCRYICYLQDIYPEIAVSLGQLPSLIPVSLARRLFHGAYRSADRVIVLSEDMRDFMLSIGVAPERLSVVPNWVDTSAVYPVKQDNPFRTKHSLDDKFVVMYSGNMGLSQPLEMVLEMADRMRDETDVAFVLIGGGARTQELQDTARQRKLTNVLFFDYQPKDRLAESLSAADLHLVFLQPEIISYLMPSKIYSILASGTPSVIVSRGDSELARMAQEHDVGFSCEIGDVDCLVQLVHQVRSRSDLDAMCERCRELAVEQYDRLRVGDLFAGQIAMSDGYQANRTSSAVTQKVAN